MTNQQLIKKIKNQITNTHSLITTYENQLANHKNLLQILINQLQEIKENMKLKNVMIGTTSIRQEKTPQQLNGDDCGVYVMAITELIIDRYKKNPLKMS